MGKTNALIVRYVVEIEKNGTYQTVPDITSVNGFDLGEEGTIEVPEWDRDVMVANGKRKVGEVSLKFRIMQNMQTFAYFKEWWDNRGGDNRTIKVTWCKRNWVPILEWIFEDNEFAKFGGEDQELGTVKLGYIENKFYPYEKRAQYAADTTTPIDPLANTITVGSAPVLG
jgi:hypothetical protein